MGKGSVGQSFVSNYIHIVFSTKHRVASIIPPYEALLHDYLGRVCQSLECQPIKIGGYDDHVHILCHLSTKVALMNLVEKLKSHSSKWMKTQDSSLHAFYWQNGYGAFSVRSSDIQASIDYITHQHAHHKTINFQEEYRLILNKCHIEYDEHYMWD